MKELAVFINQSGGVPVYEQIYEFIKREIRKGNIKTGERLPSTRNMSSYLQVSRSTVLASYEQLLAEGYIEARERKGYYAIEIEKDFADNQENTINNSRDMVYINPYTIDFSPNGIETEHFPVNEWRKISKNIFTDEMKNLFNSGDKRGDDGLREQLAVFLQKSRGVKADKSRIILGAGNENLLMLIKLLLPGNVIFAVENPVYKKSYDILRNFTDNVIPVGLDKDGLSVKELEKSNADVAYLTPSHQYPLGHYGKEGEAWHDTGMLKGDTGPMQIAWIDSGKLRETYKESNDRKTGTFYRIHIFADSIGVLYRRCTHVL